MKISLFNTQHAKLMKNALDVYAKQIRGNAENIANIDRPGYVRKRTNFAEELQAARSQSGLNTTHQKHISHPHYSQESKASGSSEKNSVDLTQEMSELAENQIRHEFVSKTLAKYYMGLKRSIRGQL